MVLDENNNNPISTTFIFLSAIVLTKSAQFVAKRFAVKWRELEEWYRSGE